jgi:hypothetical protein
MKNKKLSAVQKMFLLDMAGYLMGVSTADITQSWGFSNILKNVQHDIHGILTMKPEDCFLPKTSGFSKHLRNGGSVK